jgi:putative endonuclease
MKMYKLNTKQTQQKTSYSRGVCAETKAKGLLTRLGYKILKSRYKTKHGEVDIIASKENVLSIIEVKARQSMQQARESISRRQQQRIENAAVEFLCAHPEHEQDDIQFCAVFVADNQINFLEHAWYSQAC